jgi:hypothetical protein
MKMIKYIFNCICGIFNCQNYLFSEIDSHKWETKYENNCHIPDAQIV